MGTSTKFLHLYTMSSFLVRTATRPGHMTRLTRKISSVTLVLLAMLSVATHAASNVRYSPDQAKRLGIKMLRARKDDKVRFTKCGTPVFGTVLSIDEAKHLLTVQVAEYHTYSRQYRKTIIVPAHEDMIKSTDCTLISSSVCFHCDRDTVGEYGGASMCQEHIPKCARCPKNAAYKYDSDAGGMTGTPYCEKHMFRCSAPDCKEIADDSIWKGPEGNKKKVPVCGDHYFLAAQEEGRSMQLS